MSVLINRIGDRFGRLTVLSRSENRNGRVYWNCQCDCGTRLAIRGLDLPYGDTRSCGCLQRELSADRKRVHGHSTHRGMSSTYRSWTNMKVRCLNPNYKHYKHYGGRGISVCDRWLNSFKNFLQDMGERPSGLTLERINNNGNYEPGNCKWATIDEQNNNSRNNHKVEFYGAWRTIAQLSRLTGIKYETLQSRLRRHGCVMQKA